MIPISLSLSGFLSYRDTTEISFEGIDLACISGSNGAGKSSILDGITFALFGQARKRDDSLINTHKDIEQAEVIFVFDYESNRYKVQRIKAKEKSGLLELHIQDKAGKWKTLSERTMRDTDARIEEILRLDYETFVNAAFFLQGKADQFTQQRPADRKRILSAILGLEVWEEYRSRTGEKRRSLDGEIASLEGRIREINEELGEEDERKARLKDLTAELERAKTVRGNQEVVLGEVRKRSAALEQQSSMVKTLVDQLERRRDELETLRTRLTVRQAESQQYEQLLGRKAEIQKEYEQLLALQAEQKELDKQATGFREEEQKRAAHQITIEREQAALENELKSLETREAELIERQEQAKQLASQIAELEKEAAKLEAAEKLRADLETQLVSAKEEQARLGGENPLLEKEMKALQARIQQIETAKGATCPTCGQDLTEEHRSTMIAEWTKDGKERGDLWRANKAELQGFAKQISDLEAKVVQAQNEEQVLRQSKEKLDQSLFEQKAVQAQIEQWEAQGRQRLTEVRELLKSEGYAAEARQALATINAALQAIGYDTKRHETVRLEVETKGKVAEEFQLLEKAEASLQPLQRETQELSEQADKLSSEIAELEDKHTEAVAALAAEMAGQTNLNELENQHREMLESENLLQQEVGAASQRVAVLDDIRKRKKNLEAEREEIAKQISQLQSLERAFGKDGVPAMLIEQALPQIESKANEILERLSGGQMSIRFQTQAEYKDKKRDDKKETLEIQISDNQGTRDYEMFSGGEAFRINFAIRLALSEVLAQRAGARLQTLVIDEGFGSQDEAGRQRLVEAINMVKNDFAKILVITHIDALKDVFPNRIEVEKGLRGSTVVVN